MAQLRDNFSNLLKQFFRLTKTSINLLKIAYKKENSKKFRILNTSFLNKNYISCLINLNTVCTVCITVTKCMSIGHFINTGISYMDSYLQNCNTIKVHLLVVLQEVLIKASNRGLVQRSFLFIFSSSRYCCRYCFSLSSRWLINWAFLFQLNLITGRLSRKRSQWLVLCNGIKI